MSISNTAKHWFALALIVLLSACANINPSDNSAKPNQQDSNSNVTEKNDHSTESSNSGDQQTNDPSLQKIDGTNVDSGQVYPKADDPMASVEAPASLQKIYREFAGLVQANQSEAALELLKNAASEYPTLSGPSYRIAKHLFDLKRFDDALEHIETAISINQKNYYALTLKGVTLRELGRFEDSKSAYIQSLNVYPDYPYTHLNLAILADIYLYDLELALSHFQTYARLTNNTDDKVAGWIIDLERRMKEMSNE